MNEVLFLLGWLLLWAIVYHIVAKYIDSKTKQSSQKEADQILKNAGVEKDKIITDAKLEKNEILNKADVERDKILEKARQAEQRIISKEDKLDLKAEELTKKQESLFTKEESLEKEKVVLSEKTKELEWKISEIAKLTQEEARELFLKQMEERYEKDAISLLDKRKAYYKEKEKEEVREILIKAMQQYSCDVTTETTSTVIPLESDDIKWRLIWKEGRNIITFEKATGVSLIIDDTPDTVFISSFDLYRRYVAKVSLEKLLEDKRIQPARIEEIVENTKGEADVLLKSIGQKTLDELDIKSLPEEIVKLVWKLRFRTSYGQNILQHSREMAFIAESIARDLWIDTYAVRVWALLHDIGKALDHDIEWNHPEIWARVARKYGISEDIVDMIENHHGEPTMISLNSAIIQVADTISSVRPWARRESIELYLKRIKELETLVQSFSWVNNAYAVSAWREVRVFVDADVITDIEAVKMARDIADKIQENGSYPWEVKVNLIREIRVIEYAK